MPGDNINRAIKKGTGELEGFTAEEIIYEGYGPSGVAVIAETLSDNRNRTGGEIRHIFTKHGGSLGEVNSVNWMFDRKGVIQVPRSAMNEKAMDEDAMLETALECGADDVETDDPEVYRILCPAADFHNVMRALEEKKVTLGEAQLERIPKTTKELSEGEAEKFLKFYEALEDHDDVQQTFANFEISDEIMEALTS